MPVEKSRSGSAAKPRRRTFIHRKVSPVLGLGGDGNKKTNIKSFSATAGEILTSIEGTKRSEESRAADRLFGGKRKVHCASDIAKLAKQ